jgi:hypothetical protein
MCINSDPRTPLLDRIMGTFPSYKPTAGIESGGVVLQKPRIYSICKHRLRCFKALGETEHRGGGFFICEIDVSAILVNLDMRRFYACIHSMSSVLDYAHII